MAAYLHRSVQRADATAPRSRAFQDAGQGLRVGGRYGVMWVWLVGLLVFGWVVKSFVRGTFGPTPHASVVAASMKGKSRGDRWMLLHEEAERLSNFLWKLLDAGVDDEKLFHEFDICLSYYEEAAKVASLKFERYPLGTGIKEVLERLARQNRVEDAKVLIHRYRVFNENIAKEVWVEVCERLKDEREDEAEHQRWIESVPALIQAHRTAKKHAPLYKLACKLSLSDMKSELEAVVGILDDIGKTPPDKMNLLRASVARLSKDYNTAKALLVKAHGQAVEAGVRTRVNAVAKEARKLFRDLGSDDAIRDAERLLL